MFKEQNIVSDYLSLLASLYLNLSIKARSSFSSKQFFPLETKNTINPKSTQYQKLTTDNDTRSKHNASNSNRKAGLLKEISSPSLVVNEGVATRVHRGTPGTPARRLPSVRSTGARGARAAAEKEAEEARGEGERSPRRKRRC